MKIEQIETIRHRDFPNLLFVLVYSDGLVGLGETFYSAEAVESYIHSVAAPLLVGQDPSRIVGINRSLEGYVGYAGSGVETRARSAVDIALWDLAGQRAGLPLHDLMGGRTRDSIGVYNTCAGTQYVRREGQATQNYGRGVDGRWEDLDRFMSDAGSLAEELLSEGITGMKIWPFDAYAEMSHGAGITSEQMQAGLDPIRKIRAAVGDQMSVMIELHALWSVPAAASIVRALEPYSPFWIEDPVRSDLPGALREIHEVASRCGTMIAAGETVVGLTGYLPLLGEGAIDVATAEPAEANSCCNKLAAPSQPRPMPVRASTSRRESGSGCGSGCGICMFERSRKPAAGTAQLTGLYGRYYAGRCFVSRHKPGRSLLTQGDDTPTLVAIPLIPAFGFMNVCLDS